MADKSPKFLPGSQTQEPVGQQPNVYIYAEYLDHLHAGDLLVFSAPGKVKKLGNIDAKNPQLPHAVCVYEGERHQFDHVMVAGSLEAKKAAFQARAAQVIAVPGQSGPGRMPGVMSQSKTIKMQPK